MGNLKASSFDAVDQVYALISEQVVLPAVATQFTPEARVKAFLAKTWRPIAGSPRRFWGAMFVTAIIWTKKRETATRTKAAESPTVRPGWTLPCRSARIDLTFSRTS